MNTTPKTPLALLADAADEQHRLAGRLTDAAEELLPEPTPAPLVLPTVNPEHLRVGDRFRAIYEYRVDRVGDWQPVAPNRYELVCHDDDPRVAVVARALSDALDDNGVSTCDWTAEAVDILARLDEMRADS